MNLPIPELSEFVAGFASCAALIAGAVFVKHTWPVIKSVFSTTEAALYADYKAAINAAHSKIDALSNAFATAVNAVRGDVKGVQMDIAYVQDRLVTLERAVGIADPTVAAAAAVVAMAPAMAAPVGADNPAA